MEELLGSFQAMTFEPLELTMAEDQEGWQRAADRQFLTRCEKVLIISQ